ncbi:UTRA domain-containing protein [Carnobacterium sp. ISL-102]|uniref:UTRA domain-containing protein n=1 Tax=Carnobacterium sp. ISL-102 TaxID=2819142 RepID=UPI002035D55F|nr:UTRA domain-containing protein [Carnobacterium sp. ISL-102]
MEILESNGVIYQVRGSGACVRYIESRPFCVEKSYYLKTVVPYLNNEIASQSIFNYLTNDLKINIRFSDLFMRIGKLNQEEAAYLQLETHDPLFNYRKYLLFKQWSTV